MVIEWAADLPNLMQHLHVLHCYDKMHPSDWMNALPNLPARPAAWSGPIGFFNVGWMSALWGAPVFAFNML
jgi:hypothetical protein